MIAPPHFTPWSALGGGALIGLAAGTLYLFAGRIAGVSSIFHSVTGAHSVRGVEPWRALFLAGLIAGAGCARVLGIAPAEARVGFPLPLLLLAGALVGFGTRLGSGCTSGHGVCGVARLSLRSVLATVVFVVLGVLTTTLVRHLFGLEL